MSRLRQAMTAAAEPVSVAGDVPPLTSTLVSLGPVQSRRGAAMLEGAPEQIAAQIVDLLRERGVLQS